MIREYLMPTIAFQSYFSANLAKTQPQNEKMLVSISYGNHSCQTIPFIERYPQMDSMVHEHVGEINWDQEIHREGRSRSFPITLKPTQYKCGDCRAAGIPSYFSPLFRDEINFISCEGVRDLGRYRFARSSKL